MFAFVFALRFTFTFVNVFASLSAFLLAFTLSSSKASAKAEDSRWQGQVPKVADKVEDWNKLLPEMIDRQMYYGSLAGARDVLNFFSDLPSKVLAYSTIIKFVDLGYPFSTRSDFVPGDIDPQGNDNFSESYLLYKAMINHEKKMEKWADYYFGKIDKENFPKYLFFRATEAYVAGHAPEAIGLLDKALKVTHGPDQLVLAKKEARTLARIYYETGEFEKSLEIYNSFLLKLNPVVPMDWLEAAWNLYQMKKFSEALGVLYNLESHVADTIMLPEKYVLRGLIYREFCATEATDELSNSFDHEFGSIIKGIKMGEPLASFPELVRLERPEAQEYRQFVKSIEELEIEQKRISNLTPSLQGLAKYVYATELTSLKRRKLYYEDQALEAIARHLVILGESLRFLKFDVAREKFNPDRVFTEVPIEPAKLVESTDDMTFRLHWLQWGDYWRDERMLYQGLMKSKCDH